MDIKSLPELSDDYYVENFHTLVSFVVRTYYDLLNEEELHWYQSICDVSLQAQRLYIRLSMRKGSTFRMTGLSYPEIVNLENAATELDESMLATRQAPGDLPLLLTCFTKAELLDLLSLPEHRNLPRVVLCENILGADDIDREQHLQCLQNSDRWISLSGHPQWMLMQLCFFGNLYQNSSEFVLQQLGTLTYESYTLDPKARAFTSRRQIEAHWRYFECAALFDVVNMRSAEDLIQLTNTLPEAERDDDNLIRRVDRLRNKIARQLERLSCSELACDLYKLSIHPPARERRVRIMMAQHNWRSARLLCQQMLKSPCNESERLVAERLIEQCNKHEGLTYRKKLAFKPASSKLVLADTGQRVEAQAQAFYNLNGECFHIENTLVTGVLGLLIWDIIFHPLPGVFFNPFQVAPSDYYEPEFRHRRAGLLQSRFDELDESCKLTARVQQAYAAHYGKLNPLVRWQGLSPRILELALARVPGNHWRALFERILNDTRENSTGLPDLVLFPDSGDYEFIEIKGPGDALQANQRRWMQYFNQHMIPYRVVHVRYRQSAIDVNP